jgi:hypothetical protein
MISKINLEIASASRLQLTNNNLEQLRNNNLVIKSAIGLKHGRLVLGNTELTLIVSRRQAMVVICRLGRALGKMKPTSCVCERNVIDLIET